MKTLYIQTGTSFFQQLQSISEGILATVLNTEGHTYKKSGDKALFPPESLFPAYGNLGAGCLDRQIISDGKMVLKKGTPRQRTIETDAPEDIHFGTGTYCGGTVTLLLEPIRTQEKKTYSTLDKQLSSRNNASLYHVLDTGDLYLEAENIPDHHKSSSLLQEDYSAPVPLILYGATPLAREVLHKIRRLPVRPVIVDWREAYVDQFRQKMEGEYPVLHERKKKIPFTASSCLLLLSHSFVKDFELLQKALDKRLPYIGLLSSTQRKKKLFSRLENEGYDPERLEQCISSPVGLPIQPKTDPEIAVSITSELVQHIRNTNA